MRGRHDPVARVAICGGSIDNLDVPRFLLSVGARVTTLDDDIFNSVTKAWLQEEMKKLEVSNAFRSLIFPSQSPFFFTSRHIFCL